MVLPWKTPLYGRDSNSVSHPLLVVNASDQLELNGDELVAHWKGRLTFVGTDPNSGFVLPVLTTTQRDAYLNKVNGLTILNSTTGEVEVYRGSGFVAVGAANFDLPFGTTFMGRGATNTDYRLYEVVTDLAADALRLNADELPVLAAGSWRFDPLGTGASLRVPAGNNTYSGLQPLTAGRVHVNTTTGSLHYSDGTRDYVLNGQALGTGDAHRVRLAGLYTTTAASTALEPAGAGWYDATEVPIYPTAARKLFLRAIIRSTTGGKAVRVKLWRVDTAAYVTDLDGAGHDYLETTAAIETRLESQNLNTGSSSSFGAGTQGIYVVHVQSLDAAAQAVLLGAELVCETIGGP